MANPIPPRSANSAQPSKLAKPVPGDDQGAEVDAFMAKYNPPEVQAPPDEEAYTSPEIQQQQEVSDTFGQGAALLEEGAQVAGQVLDYPGGLARTAIAAGAGGIADKPNVVTKEDVKQALKGKAPYSAEYLKRLGVPEGGKLGNVSMRGAAGFAADIASDPLTLLGKLAKEGTVLKKTLNSTNAGVEALGEAVYKSAFRKADVELLEKGKAPLSELMIKEGAPIKSAQGIAEKVNDLTSVMGKARKGLYDRATELGIVVDTNTAPLKNAEAVLENMKKNPGLRPAADELQGLLDAYKKEGKVSLEQLSDWKTSLYDSLPSSAYGPHGKLKGPAKQFKAALANDFKNIIVDVGNKGEKGLGDEIEMINNRFGTLLNAAKPTAQNAKSAGGGSLGTTIEGAVLATGGVKALAAKKAFDLATGTGARTLVGRALMEAGRKRLIEDATRRTLVNTLKGGNPLQIIPEGSPVTEEPPPE